MANKHCAHESFEADFKVGRLEGTDGRPMQFTADVKIRCKDCRRPFQFLGLPAGINLQGAAVSVDGLEARLAICPQGEVPSPLDNIVVGIGSPDTGTAH